MIEMQVHIVRLGQRKWHIVRVHGSAVAATACGLTLENGFFGEGLFHSHGKPTCKHCQRWWAKQPTGVWFGDYS